MKKIIEIKKKNNDQYTVVFNDESLVIEQETYFKYRQVLLNEISKKDFDQMFDFNQYTYLYKIGIKKLKKLMTKKEMYEFLTLNGGKESIVKQIVLKFQEKKYIDDYYYAKTYIQLKNNTEGPIVIKNKLMKKGINIDLIDELLNLIDYDHIVKNLIIKKLKTIRNKSKRDTYQILTRYLIQKGFDIDQMKNMIEYEMKFYQFDDLEVLKLEYEKLRMKYQNKFDEKELKIKLTQKLYQKGFNIEDIKKCMSLTNDF
jgi:regulatory protein